ncbi:ankyrin repeat domain-containing protein [Rossellomorea arthrocnemi]
MKKALVVISILCISVWGFYWYLQNEKQMDADTIQLNTDRKQFNTPLVKSDVIENLPEIWEMRTEVELKLGKSDYYSDKPSNYHRTLFRKEWIEDFNWGEKPITVGYLPFYYVDGKHYLSESAKAAGEEQKRTTSLSLSLTDSESSQLQTVIEEIIPADAEQRIQYKKVGERKNDVLRIVKEYDNQYFVYSSPSVPYDTLVEIVQEKIVGEEELPSELDIHASLITENEFEEILSELATGDDVTNIESMDGTEIPTLTVTNINMSGTGNFHTPRESSSCEAGNDQTLKESIESGDISKLEQCIQAGADVNADLQGSRPLLVAIGTGNIEVIETLLTKGADPNLGSSAVAHFPLEQTIKRYNDLENSHAIVTLLLQYGADPYTVSEEGTTALETAREMGLMDVVDVME